jgi:hypothetical protein
VPVRPSEEVRAWLARAAAWVALVVRTPAGRRAGLRRLAAGAVVAAVAGWCATSQQRAGELRGRWDATVEVVVSRRDLPTGSPVDGADLEVQARPAALVPRGALRAVPDGPLWAVADIVAGEVLLRARTSEEPGRRAVPPGRAAMEVPLAQPLRGLRAGDRVDVLASAPDGTMPGLPAGPGDAGVSGLGAGGPGAGDAGASGPGAGAPPVSVPAGPGGPGWPPSAVLVAADALVLDGDDEPGPDGGPASLTVAVRDEDVGVAAAALLAGPVAVVRRPPP